jgi:hypothetical protein
VRALALLAVVAVTADVAARSKSATVCRSGAGKAKMEVLGRRQPVAHEGERRPRAGELDAVVPARTLTQPGMARNRRAERARVVRWLKGARRALWKRPERLVDRQQANLAAIEHVNRRLYRGYLLNEAPSSRQIGGSDYSTVTSEGAVTATCAQPLDPGRC